MFICVLFYPIPSQLLWLWTKQICLYASPSNVAGQKFRDYRRLSMMQLLVKMFCFYFRCSFLKHGDSQSMVLGPAMSLSPRFVRNADSWTPTQICWLRISDQGLAIWVLRSLPGLWCSLKFENHFPNASVLTLVAHWNCWGNFEKYWFLCLPLEILMWLAQMRLSTGIFSFWWEKCAVTLSTSAVMKAKRRKDAGVPCQILWFWISTHSCWWMME